MAKIVKAEIAKQFKVKKGCSVQHANTSYGEGAIAPFDSDDVDLVLFHAANIEVVESDLVVNYVEPVLLDQKLENSVPIVKFTEDKP